MSNYKSTIIEQLKDEQLRSASREERLRQIQVAEQLLSEIDPQGTYRPDEVGERVVRRRPESRSDRTRRGDEMLHDLRLLIEDLSDSVDVSVENVGEPVLTVQDVSRRFNVSTKTVDRWRDRGLVSRRFLFGNRKRVGFLKSSVDRFESEHSDIVSRGSEFSQMTDEERDKIIRQARQLAAGGSRPADVATRLGQTFGRSAETIRYTVKNHDLEHPESAVFPSASSPLTDEIKGQLFREFRRGVSLQRLADRYGRSQATLERIVNEVRAQRLKEESVEYIYNEEFEAPDAEKVILGPEPEPNRRKNSYKPPAGLPPYLASLYQVSLLTKEQEVYFFRKMNYLKFRAARLLEKLDVKRPRVRDMDRIEELLRQATDVKNLLIRRNLRLVVSVAKKYARPDSNFFEMVSDGNISLIRAIEKFDYGRGFKLSTYATWAIRKNFARSIPAEHTHKNRFRTGNDEFFQASHDEGANPYQEEQDNRRQHEALMTILNRLNARERDIILYRFGLRKGAEPLTLQEVGEHFDVSKERIRQLEARAIGKMRDIVAQEKLDIPGI